jgi:thiol-disulfide isomerase/thioredoxin
MGKVVTLKTRDELKNFLKNNRYVIVKVSATWCGPCKRIQPLVNLLYSKLQNVDLVLVDYDEGKDIVSYLRVKSVPYLINYINGTSEDILTSSNKENVINFFNSFNKKINSDYKNLNNSTILQKLLNNANKLEQL